MKEKTNNRKETNTVLHRKVVNDSFLMEFVAVQCLKGVFKYQ